MKITRDKNAAPHSSDQAATATAWHALDVSAVAVELQADSSAGLSPEEASNRLARFGANAILEKPPRPIWRMLLDQFSDFMILVLVAAAVVSGIVGDIKDTLAIVVIILLLIFVIAESLLVPYLTLRFWCFWFGGC